MECQDYEALLPGYIDGELDLMQSVEVERHLAGCAKCRRAVESQRALQSALRTAALYKEPRAGLSRDILRAAKRRERAAASPLVACGRRYSLVTAFAALLLLIGWGLGRFRTLPAETDLLANEALAGHVRSLMANHLVDVVSSDRHTVKPWFNGRVDYAPPVIEMADQGFPLAGGRLDYLDGRPVTALVYRRQRHIINLFLWPTSSADTGMELLARQGYHMIHWTRARLAYWVVSDLNPTELREFTERYQERVTLSNRP